MASANKAFNKALVDPLFFGKMKPESHGIFMGCFLYSMCFVSRGDFMT